MDAWLVLACTCSPLCLLEFVRIVHFFVCMQTWQQYLLAVWRLCQGFPLCCAVLSLYCRCYLLWYPIRAVDSKVYTVQHTHDDDEYFVCVLQAETQHEGVDHLSSLPIRQGLGCSCKSDGGTVYWKLCIANLTLVLYSTCYTSCVELTLRYVLYVVVVL